MRQKYRFQIMIYIEEISEEILITFLNRIREEHHFDVKQLECIICRSREELSDLLQEAENSCNSSIATNDCNLSDIEKVCKILLTDSKETAKKYRNSDMVCIGYQPAESGFFAAAAMVVERLEDLDLQASVETYLHEKYFPVTVARTERLILREIEKPDIPFLRSMSTAEGMEEGFLDHLTGEDSFTEEKLLAYMENAYRFFGYGLWITTKEETRMGCCGFGNWDCEEENGRVELQYALLPEFRGQGYAQEMCREALNYLFSRTDVDVVWLRILPENHRSVRLALKLGFRKQESNEFYQIFLLKQKDMKKSLA